MLKTLQPQKKNQHIFWILGRILMYDWKVGKNQILVSKIGQQFLEATKLITGWNKHPYWATGIMTLTITFCNMWCWVSYTIVAMLSGVILHVVMPSVVAPHLLMPNWLTSECPESTGKWQRWWSLTSAPTGPTVASATTDFAQSGNRCRRVSRTAATFGRAGKMFRFLDQLSRVYTSRFRRRKRERRQTKLYLSWLLARDTTKTL